jgi:WD40 repeat protein
MLASGSVDETIILWNVKNYQRIGALSGNRAPIEGLVFSPNGKTLASISIDITLWDANEQLWVVASCQRAGRNFTRNEWKIYFPNDAYRPTCLNFPVEPAVTPTETP